MNHIPPPPPAPPIQRFPEFSLPRQVRRPTYYRRRRPTVIEQTAKRWKFLQVLGGFIFIVGCFIVFIGISESMAADEITNAAARRIEHDAASDRATTGIHTVLTGILAYLIGRIGGWWFHG